MKNLAIALALIAALSAASMSLAGPLQGPGTSNKIVPANSSVWYNETFVGGEIATVRITGDGDTDVDIYVYDSAGRIVARAIGLSDRESCSFLPLATQNYRIEIRNLGNVWNRVLVQTY